MSWIRAVVVAYPVSDDQVQQDTINLVWDAELAEALKDTPKDDYRARAHKLIDALFDKDERMRDGHYYSISLQP